MNDLDYLYARAYLEDLRKQGEKERLLKPYKLSWRVRSARALNGLARRLEPKSVVENDHSLETI